MSDNTEQPVPPGWVATSLREILLISETTDPSRQGNGEFSYVDIEAIDNKSQLIAQPKRLANSAAPSRARNKLAAGGANSKKLTKECGLAVNGLVCGGDECCRG
jgi:hypothetical protein